MAQSRKKYCTLIKDLEAFRNRDPKTYNQRVTLIALLGYAYIGLVLAVLLIITALLVLGMIHSKAVGFAKMGIVFVIIIFYILKSLWVKFEAPVGFELNPKQFPEFFAMIADIAKRMNSPVPHSVILTDDFNAAIMQVPRLGIFGFPRNYLVIGIPLMHALSPEKFKAILAHELGHLSENHGKLASWIYRIRMTWWQLHSSLCGDQGGSSIVFTPFMKWYVPYFDAYTFVLARSHEYAADDLAGNIAGKRTAAEALIEITLQGRHMDTNLPTVLDKAAMESEEPMQNLVERVMGFISADVDPEEARTYLAKELKIRTWNSDTHPSLTDRLKALGAFPTEEAWNAFVNEYALPSPETRASTYYLRDNLNETTKVVSQIWAVKNFYIWKQRNAYLKDVQGKLQSLEEQAQARELTDAELLNRAQWTEDLKGQDAALPPFPGTPCPEA